ncbi:glycosyltransferase family 4 protein [Myxococcota bacterium]|nr:glycosyltransferase family 4 protein [Myxococcota bacterium]
MPSSKPSILYLNENSSFPFDNRARREMGTLKEQGADILVVCPAFEGGPGWEGCQRAPDRVSVEEYDGLPIWYYPFPEYGHSLQGHLGEYAVSLMWLQRLAWRAYRTRGFDAIYAVNPPDLLWPIALQFKALGKRFVFDHYDLNPELFQDRFGDNPKAMKALPLVKAMEKATITVADRVISTNGSYRRIAIERCGKDPSQVIIVRNGPDMTKFRPDVPDPTARAMGRIVVGYLGNMNPQDGLDEVIEMARILRYEEGRTDIGFVLVGQGDSYKDVVKLRDDAGLKDVVHMPGRLPMEQVRACLSAADICVQPDPPGGLNNVSTMNKVMEYMAMGKPVIAHALKETMVSGGDVAVYTETPDARGLAARVLELADDPARRKALGEAGLRRCEEVLSWPHQAPCLLRVFEELFPGFAPEHRDARPILE